VKSRFIVAAMLLLSCGRIADAQCSPVFSINYATYTDLTVVGTDDNGGSAQTSINIQGYANMSVGGSCPDYVRASIQQQINNATHQPRIYNHTSSNGGNGGWATGSSACYNCYFNYTTYANTGYMPDDTNATWNYEAIMMCTMAGAIYDTGTVNWPFELAKTLSQYAGPGLQSGQYKVQPWCTSTTTKPDYLPIYAIDRSATAPSPYYLQKAFCIQQQNNPIRGVLCIPTTDKPQNSPQDRYSCTKRFTTD